MRKIKQSFVLYICRIIIFSKVIYSKFLYTFWGLETVCIYLARQNGSMTYELLKRYKANIGNNVNIQGLLIVHKKSGDFSNLIIGDNCHIGKNVFLDLTDKIVIKKNCTISMGTMILTHLDIGNALNQANYPRVTKPVTILEGTYVGARAIILSGVIVGKNAMIAAGSLVKKDVPPNSLVAGVPSRVIKEL